MLIASTCWLTISATILAAPPDDDLADQIARARATIDPAPTPPNTTLPNPNPPPPADQPDPQPAPGATSQGASPSSASTPSDRNLPAALVGVLIACLALVAVSGRRWKRHTTTRVANRGQRAGGQVDDNRLETLDVIEVGSDRWVDAELRLLVHRLPNRCRYDMNIQLVQLDGHSLEVAFVEMPDVAPPAGWTRTGDRAWRLDQPHDNDALTVAQHLAPITGAFIAFRANDEHNRMYGNVVAFAGLNVTGEPERVHQWIEDSISYLADWNRPCSPRVLAVADNQSSQFSGLVKHVTESDALEQALRVPDRDSVLGRLQYRRRAPTSSPALVILLTTASHDDRWEQIATQRSVAVLSTKLHFINGLDIEIGDTTVAAPSIGIPGEPTTQNRNEHPGIGACHDEAAADPVEQQPTTPANRTAPDHSELAIDPWQAPSWPVMINVLGTPSVTKQGDPVRLTPQQLSALALIAIRSEIPAHDFKRAIWGDEDDVSAERVRDMLSVLRKKVGGLTVIPKREDGLITAGPDLGSDLQVFETLEARCRAVPNEQIERLHQMIALLRGRPFNYSSTDQTWWRWAEIAYGMTDWTYKATTAAEALARIHLARGEPDTARSIAERGLAADPLNAALTETLMEAYAHLGMPEASQRTYESLDRSLGMSDLGGANNESLHLLHQLRNAAATRIDTDAANAS